MRPKETWESFISRTGCFSAVGFKVAGMAFSVALFASFGLLLQDRIPSKEDTKTIMSMWSSLVDKIKEWVEKYGEIHGGSMNPEKTIKYQRIFLRYGLNCSDIYQGNGGTGFIISPK